MKINLVQGGIFPIKDNLEKDSTGLSVSGTLQGEGKLIGTTCLFIRTSACNLRCAWLGADGKGSPCDTPYSSHKPEKNIMEVDDIIEIVVENTQPQNIKHIVVSGGEPTMQTEALEELVEKLSFLGYHITIETNGTIFSEKLAKFTDLVSISPKLASSTPFAKHLEGTGIKFSQKWVEKHERDRINILALRNWVTYSKDYGNDFQFKFVISTKEDLQEVEELISDLELTTGLKEAEQYADYRQKLMDSELYIQPSDVCLMPEGVDTDSLDQRTSWMLEEAIKRGWRFTPRLHVQLFGKNRYV